MSMRGSCDCHNIEIAWDIIDYSLVPRACQCDYCVSKSAAYVSKSGTKLEVLIRNNNLHSIVQHGSNNAAFHECGNCGQVVFVTVEIEGELYGALNANKLDSRLDNGLGFAPPVQVNFSDQTADQKRERWRRNWCHPVLIKILEK